MVIGLAGWLTDRMTHAIAPIPFLLALSVAPCVAAPALVGRIVDDATGDPLEARLYIRSEADEWFHARAAEGTGGAAVPYAVRRGTESVEVHTTLSAHPFVAELPPGKYSLGVERGKEFHPESLVVEIGEAQVEVELRLRRWTDMAARGWFSGETHVHRPMAELGLLVRAEDLNVALPLTAWVTDSRESPSQANKNPDPVPPAKLVEVDATHVIWPVNTEYEIFSVAGRNHTLGAVFILNHREPFALAAPPVKPIAEEARRQGALLDLDKHNWPWSMMLVPVMGVGLYELTNNHLWRAPFAFDAWYPEFAFGPMADIVEGGRFTERGWIDFGFRNYYALLNCGFDIKPSAGTASGVHPVPLGFGRVYVRIDGDFRYEKWIDGLAAGRSFVTTGPMLVTEMRREGDAVWVTGSLESASPPGPVEIVRNGEVASVMRPQAVETKAGAYRFAFEARVPVESSSWIAVRAFEARTDGRPRFAHTAPQHFAVEGKPLRPKREEVAYLVKRVDDELRRHAGVLGEAAMAEYRAARAFYQSLAEKAE